MSAPLVVFNAAAIAVPMRMVLDSFAARTGQKYEQETAASLELVRKVLELQQNTDVMVLADPDLFPEFLMPSHVSSYALFARNRIVLAYTDRSRGAAEIDSTNWYEVLQRPGVEVGRSDPNTDPSGYRTLLVWQLAEQHYKVPGLYDRMLRAAPQRNVRPREAEQVALLSIGEYDYTWTYQNLADNAGFRYVKLPDAIDLGSPAESTAYARASTRVLGRKAGDTLTVTGRPILFGVAVFSATPRRSIAEDFVAFLLSADGRRIMRAAHFDALDSAMVVGTTHR
jgi:molybdate/tungstate transport system substrate-binding protein